MHQTLYTGTSSFTEGLKNLSSRSVDSSYNFRRFWFLFLIFPRIGGKITQSCLPMKGYPELGKVLLVESEIREVFACGIRNSGLSDSEYSTKNPESHDQLESRIQVPLTKNSALLPGIWNPQSMAWNVESKTVFVFIAGGESCFI